MDYSRAFAISAAGMTAERTRVDIAALNLANANTVQGADGARYQPLRAVLHSVAAALAAPADFTQEMGRAATDAGDMSAAGLTLPQVSVEPAGTPPRKVYEPGHPLADANGFVAYAAVDSATEMVNMMSAMRSYEANVAAMNMSKTLALRALDIGGSGA